MAAPRRRLALFAAVAGLLVTAASLGAVEVALRLADWPPAAFSPWIRSDDFGFRLAPGISMRMREAEYDVEVATNSLGMRDDEPAAKAGPRLLLLGDSFTMGYGVERGRLFADLLEKDLAIDVVNAGTGGYEIVQQPRVLAVHGPGLRPDFVLYALYLGNDLAQNDEWEVRPDGSLHNLQREYPVRTPGEWKLARLARNALYGVRKGRSEAAGEWLPFEGYLGLCEKELGQEAREDYDLSEKLLVDVAAEAKRLGAPLLVAMIPYRSMVEEEARASLAARVPGLDERYDLGRPAREVAGRLGRHGIDHVDLTPFLVEESRRVGGGLFYPVDGHLTDAGNEAVARFLATALRERMGRPRPDL